MLILDLRLINQCVSNTFYQDSKNVLVQMETVDKNKTRKVEAKPGSSGLRLRTDKSFAFRQFDFEDSEGENELERLIL